MNRPTKKKSRVRKVVSLLVVVLAVLASPVAALATFGWPASRHAREPSTTGTSRSTADLEAVVDVPGPLSVETIVGADWAVDRSGLINLDNPRARAAGLHDGLEPIQIYAHAVRHPTRGLFLVDTGVERAQANDPEHALIHGFVASAMHIERMHVRTDLATWLHSQPEPLRGVFLTHLHVDHVTGMRDVPADVPIYLGPGDVTSREGFNVVSQPIVDRALEGHGALREWQFRADPSGRFAGVIDVFGDGSLWAIAVPGHTPGSTAYLARTTHGPVLFLGDACHTAWGWRNRVEPGTFSHDIRSSNESLERLHAFVDRHPGIVVRLGHQALE